MSTKTKKPSSQSEINKGASKVSEWLPGKSVATYMERIGGLSGALVTLTGLAYASGFIIINIYLNTRYGIYNSELLNARYVYAGSAFLLLCFMAFFGALFLLQFMERLRDRAAWIKVVVFIFMLFATGGFCSLSVQSIVMLVEGVGIEGLSLFPIDPWFNLAVLTFAFQIWFFRRRAWEDRPPTTLFPSSVITNIIFLAAFYGIHFYSLLPSSLGGGLPVPIQLVIDESKAQAAKQLIPIASNNTSQTVYLIEQSNQSFYVLVEGSIGTSNVRPIELSKSLIIGVIYPREMKLPPYSRMNTATPAPSETPMPTVTPSPTQSITLTP